MSLLPDHGALGEPRRNARSLRSALVVNAAFSGVCALFLLTLPSRVGDWLGVTAPLIYLVLGLGLALFAAELLHQATRARVATWRALYASLSDFAWVIGTVALLPLALHVLAPRGTVTVILVALIVLALGSWQLYGLLRIHRGSRAGEYRHCIRVETAAPASAMWRVVRDLGRIHAYMPSLKHSEVLEGLPPGPGVIRVCEDQGGRRWSEQCTEFREGHGFSVQFAAQAPDFPFPARAMRGGWEVTPRNQGCEVMVWWELVPRRPMLAPVLLPLLAFKVDREFPAIIARMAAAAMEQADEAPASAPTGLSRLLPDPC